MEPPAEAPPEEEAATPTLLEKFRGRNTMLSVLGEHKAQEAKREAKRQREIERRRKLARRIAIYLRVGVCDYRGDALSRDASLRLIKAAQQIAGDRKVLGRALRAATEFMKDELLYEEELSEQGGLDESFVRSADSYERLPAKPFVPHRRTLRPVTLIRLIGKEVEHLDNPEAALDSLLYQASRLLNDFSDKGTPRASIEETPCPSPDRQSRERLDSRCFDSERIFRKRCVCGVARRLPTVSRRWREVDTIDRYRTGRSPCASSGAAYWRKKSKSRTPTSRSDRRAPSSTRYVSMTTSCLIRPSSTLNDARRSRKGGNAKARGRRN